jgi:catechol 2,3-dioxygenase-like lactoylglutathione lyase family enzyme
MIDHISIGVRNVAASKRFYDAALRPLGYRCLSDAPESLGYGAGSPALWINATERPVAADARSGLHFCFAAPSRKSVDDFHAAGLAAGGHDNGRPGIRPDYGAGYYAAYLIDPEGYRIEAYFAGSPS